MLFSYNLDASNEYYNPYGDDTIGCMITMMAALCDLESDTKHVQDHPEDKEVSETLLLRLAQLKVVLLHALEREFFLEQ